MTDRLSYARPLKFGSFSIAGCLPFAGVLIDDEYVIAVASLVETCSALDLPLHGVATLDALLADWDRNLASIRTSLAAGLDATKLVPISALQRHAPVSRTRHIVCVGANYRKHVIDLMVAQGGGGATEGMSREERRAEAERAMDERAANGEPYAWIKAGGALAGPDDDFVIPAWTAQADWELELAVVIGKPAFHVGRSEAWGHVAGFTIANDVTARDRVYRQDLKVLGTDWLAAKGGPGFLPTGPYLVPREDAGDPAAMTITLKLNGEIMQNETTSDMIFDIPRQIEYISSFIRLEPGDIVSTGSPAGNGAHYGRYLQPGDMLEGTVSGLGTQSVRCVAA